MIIMPEFQAQKMPSDNKCATVTCAEGIHISSSPVPLALPSSMQPIGQFVLSFQIAKNRFRRH